MRRISGHRFTEIMGKDRGLSLSKSTHGNVHFTPLQVILSQYIWCIKNGHASKSWKIKNFRGNPCGRSISGRGL